MERNPNGQELAMGGKDQLVTSDIHGGDDHPGSLPHRSKEELRKLIEVFLDLLLEKDN